MCLFAEEEWTREEFEEAAREALQKDPSKPVRVPHFVAKHSVCGCGKPQMLNMGWNRGEGPYVEEGYFLAIMNEAGEIVHNRCGRSLY